MAEFKEMKYMFQDKAEGDGLYAIAYALMCLSEDVDRIGLHRRGDAAYEGALEKIAMVLGS